MKLEDFKINSIYRVKSAKDPDLSLDKYWNVICLCKDISNNNIYLDDLVIIEGDGNLQKGWLIDSNELDGYATYELIGSKEDYPEYFL